MLQSFAASQLGALALGKGPCPVTAVCGVTEILMPQAGGDVQQLLRGDGGTDGWMDTQQCCRSCVQGSCHPWFVQSGAIGTNSLYPLSPQPIPGLVTRSLVALGTSGLPLGVFISPSSLGSSVDLLEYELCLRTLFQGSCWPWALAGEVLGVDLG